MREVSQTYTWEIMGKFFEKEISEHNLSFKIIKCNANREGPRVEENRSAYERYRGVQSTVNSRLCGTRDILESCCGQV